MSHKVILSTIHGSHLYGMSHSGSDNDWYVVVDGKMKPRHSIQGKLDVTMMGMDEFLAMAYRGVPQACEALFSPEATISPKYAPMLQSIRVMGGEAMDRYERTINAFWKGDFKQRRHAVRLEFNLIDLRENGRFNPVMTSRQIGIATELAMGSTIR